MKAMQPWKGTSIDFKAVVLKRFCIRVPPGAFNVGVHDLVSAERNLLECP